MERDSSVLKELVPQLEQTAEIAAEYKNRPDMLMTVIIRVQKIVPVLSREVATVIAREMNLPLNQVYSFITFHSLLSAEVRGRYIVRMCENAACCTNGTKEVLETVKEQLGISVGETTADGRFTLESSPCLGLCEISPALMINEKVYGNLTPESVRELIGEYMNRDVEGIL